MLLPGEEPLGEVTTRAASWGEPAWPDFLPQPRASDFCPHQLLEPSRPYLANLPAHLSPGLHSVTRGEQLQPANTDRTPTRHQELIFKDGRGPCPQGAPGPQGDGQYTVHTRGEVVDTQGGWTWHQAR